MPRELKQIKVTHISLVDEAANQKKILYKCRMGQPNITQNIPLCKTNVDEGVVYGVVYSPNEVDSQGDYAAEEEIKYAAWQFLKDLNQHNIDRNHSFKNEDAYVCESFVLHCSDPRFPDIKKGSWVVGIKLESESIKESVRRGEIRGISMAGSARTDEQKGRAMKGLQVFIKNLFQKNLSKGDTMSEDQFELLQATIKEGFEKVEQEITSLKEKVGQVDNANNEVQKRLQEAESILKRSGQDYSVPSSQQYSQAGGIL